MRPARCVAGVTAFLYLWTLSLHGQESRRIRLRDLPAGWAESESSFNRYLEELERRSRARLLEGENDHLIAYLLQSARFTTEPKIEPALSAMEYLGSDARAGRVPAAVERRMDSFLKAHPGDDARLVYFQRLVAGRGKPYLISSEYARCCLHRHGRDPCVNRRLLRRCRSRNARSRPDAG